MSMSSPTKVIVPEPVLMVKAPIEMTAVPGSRFAKSTPLAAVSLETTVSAPLSVVMLALIRMLRPA